MTAELRIPVLLGTARPGRESADVASAVLKALEDMEVATELIDVADYPISGTEDPDESARIDKYRRLAAQADGFVIVVPEYNHGYPGELKLLLDSIYDEYNHKPVGLVSVSSGLIGGARVTEQLQLVTLALEMVPVSPTVHVRMVEDAIGDDGRFAEEGLRDVLSEMLGALHWYASVLAPARAARESDKDA